MLFRWSNNLLWSALVILASGTLADQITRSFTTSAAVVTIAWLAITALLLSLIRTSKPVPITLPQITQPSNTVMSLGFIAAAISALAAFILNTAKHSVTIFTFANWIAVLIVLGGVFAMQFAYRENKIRVVAKHTYIWLSGKSALVLAVCMGITSIMANLTYRASTDDHYYVNLSTFIYERGTIPTQDTVLSNQYFASYKRFSSWEVLWGLIARLVHIPPAYLLYLVVLPVAAALSMVVYARVISDLGLSHPKIALIAITTFLVFDGVQGFTFGSFQGPRIWQGKSFFLAIVLPLLFVQIIRILNVSGELWSQREVLKLGILVVAALGATTTTFIIVIPFLAICFVIAMLHRNTQAAFVFGIANLYLVICGYLFKTMRTISAQAHSNLGAAAGVTSADYSTNTPMPQTYDLLTKLTNPGWHAAVIAIAICVGWLGLNTRFARTLVGLCAIAWGVICLPGFLEWFLTITGSRAVAWRYIWLLPIPLLIGSTASVLAGMSIRILTNRNTSVARYSLATIWIAVLAIFPMTLGTPPWQVAPKSKQVAEIAKPFSLRLGYGYVQAAKALEEIARPGDIVLARNGISSSINVMTTNYYTVSPRPAYVNLAVKGYPDGFAEERNKLGFLVTGEEPVSFAEGELSRALNAVRVNVVCITSDQKNLVTTFKGLGYDEQTKKVERKDGKLWVWCGRTSEFDL